MLKIEADCVGISKAEQQDNRPVPKGDRPDIARVVFEATNGAGKFGIRMPANQAAEFTFGQRYIITIEEGF